MTALERQVVCAAIRNKTGKIICSARHHDDVMLSQLFGTHYDFSCDVEQGFIDQNGVFMTKEEAFILAMIQGQIRRRVEGDNGKLFSENLY